MRCHFSKNVFQNITSKCLKVNFKKLILIGNKLPLFLHIKIVLVCTQILRGNSKTACLVNVWYLS